MAEKEQVYKRIKISGMLSFIPFVLAAGAIGGYVIGSFLETKVISRPFVMPVCVGIGILASFVECVKIIRKVLKIEGNQRSK